jgi:fucose permease
MNIASGLIINVIGVGSPDSMGLPENTGAFFAVMLVGMIISFILFSALLYKIDKSAKQQHRSYGEALAIGLKKLPSILLAIFLYGIAITIGTLLLLIPGIILSLSLFFYYYYIVLEDMSAYQSLKASHKLVWKDWWRTVGVFTVPTILYVIIVAGLGILSAFISPIGETPIWVTLIMGLFVGIFFPYIYTLGYVQYHDLKLRKSGSDLEARMSE